MRTRILKIARSLYASGGETALSMRRVASRVGVSAPALYHHFQNRDALLEAISDDGFDRLVNQLEKLPKNRSPVRQCIDVLAVYREFALDEPHTFHAMFVAQRPRARRYPDDFASRRSAAFSLLVDRVRAAMTAGSFREDVPEEVALTLWAHAHGLVLLQRAGRFARGLAGYRRTFDRSLMRLIKGLGP